jgi:CDP-paratose 2-epimerase
MKYTLITGGAGFVGSNLADALLSDGEAVVVVDDLSREGARHNLDWLRARHGERLGVEVADVARGIDGLVAGAARVYHLAAQVAVTTSTVDPARDFDINLLGTFRLLEAVRRAPRPPALLFASTNKVYGELTDIPVTRERDGYRFAHGREGISEARRLDFHSPYGCSKGAADQYVRDYARSFGLPTVVFRMSCVYGTRQFGTEDQGWVAHFARALLADAPITVFGDGHQVRDLLWVGDLVVALRTAMEDAHHLKGEVFNIGGGVANAASVRQVIARLASLLRREPQISFAPWRAGDQRVYVSDVAHAERRLGWRPRVAWEEGVERLLDWLREAPLPEHAARHAPSHPPLPLVTNPLPLAT